MQTIALLAEPKQSLSVVLDNVLYDIALLATNGCMSLNITRANVPVVMGQRAVAGQLVLPFKKEEGGFGNFLFLTRDGDLPAYDLFQTTQSFLYASAADLAAVRDGGLEFNAFVAATIAAKGTAVGVSIASGVGEVR